MPSTMIDATNAVEHKTVLLKALKNSPHTFLQPTSQITAATLTVVKDLLDPLAADIADAQKRRRDENRRKRKRGENEVEESILQIRKVYTNGLGVKQIWEQARRVLDAACLEVEKNVELYSRSDTTKVNGETLRNGRLNELNDKDNLEDDEELSDGDGLEKYEEDDEDAEEYDEEDEMQDEIDSGAELEEENIEDSDEDELLSDDPRAQPETYVTDPNGLNDGFFSIDDFNKQTQFLEQQDVRGDDDNPSDEDEVDWEADPLSMPFAKPNPRRPHEEDDNMSNNDSDEEDGPTFGNAELDASDSDQEMHDEDADLDAAMPGLNNTNEIRYSDFFEPPPKKPSKTKRMRALPKTQPPKQETTQTEEDVDKDIERAMNDVNRDLFASDEESLESDSNSDSDPTTPRSKNMSTHEKQRAKIAAEIRRLEAANVAKRDWTLSGEARAADRPINSLIEEDMDFERVGKPVPIITAEVTEEIERLIKRRILAREFDEVIRRHPDAIGSAAETRRGRIELDDSKPQSNLAQLYEQDHLQSTDPGYVDKRSAATKKQHAEIDRLWKDVSAQLDLLSNLHFKPKRLNIEIKTVEDKPTISMEDARPVGTGGEQSMLAPQEVYQPGEKRRGNGEVTRKSGASVSKEEMSREEKIRKRKREKERMKKAGMNAPGAGKQVGADGKKKKGKKEEKNDILADLRKGNVKVIGRKGELQDLGKQKRLHDGGQSSSAFKL